MKLFNSEKTARKKQLEEFFRLMFTPFMLAWVGSAFFKLTMLALTGGTAGGEAPDRIFAGGAVGLPFVLMCLMVYLWARPAFLYVRKPDEDLKRKIRRRVENIYRDAFIMIAVLQGVSLLLPSLVPGRMSVNEYIAAAVSFLGQVAVIVVYIDMHLSGQKTLMANLYSPEEISRLRPGFSVPIYIKVFTLLAGFALIPFALIYLSFLNSVPWETLGGDLVFVMSLSMIMLLGGLSGIYNGVQRPLDGLVSRMRAVAKGDYTKTRIYFSDEVAHLKAGYNDMVDGLKEREELQDTFGKYMSIEIARELINNKKVNLGGEDIEAAVMFCDIRNFTPLSENMSASALVEFLNNYFHYITPPVSEYNGVINKFIGDAVMAVFTPPLGSSDYAADAVRAALAMRRALAEFNASGKSPAPVEFGIGIHCGKLVAGNIGTAARLEYTFIGDTVNVASRLESKTKDFKTDIIMSGAAVEKARGSVGPAAAFQPLGKATLKGKAESMELYKVA